MTPCGFCVDLAANESRSVGMDCAGACFGEAFVDPETGECRQPLPYCPDEKTTGTVPTGSFFFLLLDLLTPPPLWPYLGLLIHTEELALLPLNLARWIVQDYGVSPSYDSACDTTVAKHKEQQEPEPPRPCRPRPAPFPEPEHERVTFRRVVKNICWLPVVLLVTLPRWLPGVILGM